MAYKNPEQDRPYKREYQLQKRRGEHEARSEREKARNAFDKKYGRAARRGKDLAHKKALANGGSNSDGVRLESPSKNRAAGGAMSKPTKQRR